MLASRAAKCRAGLGGFLGGDQTFDDVAPLHQEAMHAFIDAVDLAAQVGQCGRRASAMLGVSIWPTSGEIKENVKVPEARPDLTRRQQCHYLGNIVVVI